MRCPKCKGTSLSKEYYLGSQTGDLICDDCGYTGSSGAFLPHPEKHQDWDHNCTGVGCRHPGCERNPKNRHKQEKK